MYTAQQATNISNNVISQRKPIEISYDFDYIYDLIKQQAEIGRKNIDLYFATSKEVASPIVFHLKPHSGKTPSEKKNFYMLDVQKSVINNGFRTEADDTIFRISWQ